MMLVLIVLGAKEGRRGATVVAQRQWVVSFSPFAEVVRFINSTTYFAYSFAASPGGINLNSHG